jgi:hypothetical protein
VDPHACWAPYSGAVSLTFDDGRPSQLQKAIPAMERRGLRGTFYLGPKGDDFRERLEPWVEVARNGHEIGNHSLSHACSNNLLGGTGGLEDRTLGEMDADIAGAQERLAEIAPHQKNWTFAYPCYQTHVGRGADRKSYVPVVAKHCISGRAGGEYGFGNWPSLVDLACAQALATDRMSGFEMLGLVEGLATQGQWVILVFHDIDGSRLTVGGHDFEMLLEYLDRRSDEIWTAPSVEVAEKIVEYQKTTTDD